jgi:cystathionine beta-lyase/cystathionine gamma-synthase
VSVDRSTIWPYRDGEPGDLYYSRYNHPTGLEAERELGRLDGGHALLFSSGTGAATAVALAFLSPGATVALTEGAYFGTSVLFRELEGWGLRFVEFDQTGPPPDGADFVWLEAPSNPFLTMPRPRGSGGAPGPRARGRDGRNTGLPPPARARRGLRPSQRDEVPRRP